MLLDSFEQSVAARTIWGEARGEGDEGMKAVAHVLLNRLKLGRWGKTMGSVCLWPWQFSCWNVQDPNRPKMLGFHAMDLELGPPAAALAMAVTDDEQGVDPTGGATFYFNPKGLLRPPNWAIGKMPCAIIGNHQFFRDIE